MPSEKRCPPEPAISHCSGRLLLAVNAPIPQVPSLIYQFAMHRTVTPSVMVEKCFESAWRWAVEEEVTDNVLYPWRASKARIRLAKMSA
jgi:hypothetical protein